MFSFYTIRIIQENVSNFQVALQFFSCLLFIKKDVGHLLKDTVQLIIIN